MLFSLKAKAMWLAVWPGVVMASSVQPSPLHHLAVGERAVGLEVGVVGGLEPRPVADMERAATARCGPSASTSAPVAALIAGTPGE